VFTSSRFVLSKTQIVYSRNAMCAAARHVDNKCTPSSANKATVEGIIQLAIQETNEAFVSSGIPTRLRLVHLHYDNQVKLAK
jgi:hypothetical protein